MRKFFSLYQYLAPVLILPLSYWLWWTRSENHYFVCFALSIPIVFAYVIPGLGTNWLKLWEFNVRLKLGRFRPHHGFVFGSATSLFGWLCIDFAPHALDPFSIVQAGFIMGSVIAFWNWFYDIYMLKAGIATVYNLPYSKKEGPEAIATDYAPVVFGGFGVCYGIALRLGQYLLLQSGSWHLFWPLLAVSIVVSLVAPVLFYVLWSYARTGTHGLRAYN